MWEIVGEQHNEMWSVATNSSNKEPDVYAISCVQTRRKPSKF